MKNQIFAVEIDLSRDYSAEALSDSANLQHCLTSLRERYEEVVCLSANRYLYILAAGTGLDNMLDLLFPFFKDNRTVMLAPTEEEAFTTLMEIAGGERWKNVSVEHLKVAIHESAIAARESGRLGKALLFMLEEAWHINTYALRKNQIKRERHAYLSIPVRSFDFAALSLN